MTWKTIRLEMAGNSEFPTGSVSRGYLLRAPLRDDGIIDEFALTASPQRAIVRRFWSTEPDESGHLVRTIGHWALRCFGKPDRLIPASSRLCAGQQVSVTEPEGEVLAFQVASIRCLS